MRYKKWICGGFCVGWLGFIFSNSLKSRAQSAAQSKPLEDLLKPSLQGAGKDSTLLAELIVRKSAHIAEFFVLALLCYTALCAFGVKRKNALWLTGALCTVAASADEALQLISRRGASVKDVFIDLLGVLLGIIAIAVYNRIKHKTSL